MATRREVLQALGLAVVSGGFTELLTGCAGGLGAYRGQVENSTIRIPRSQAPQLATTNGILVVQPAPEGATIILRSMPEHGIVALSSTCTHRGCEVRPMPDGLQCPCHGSEYDEFGEVLQGPAREPLQRFQVEQTESEIVILLR